MVLIYLYQFRGVSEWLAPFVTRELIAFVGFSKPLPGTQFRSLLWCHLAVYVSVVIMDKTMQWKRCLQTLPSARAHPLHLIFPPKCVTSSPAPVEPPFSDPGSDHESAPDTNTECLSARPTQTFSLSPATAPTSFLAPALMRTLAPVRHSSLSLPGVALEPPPAEEKTSGRTAVPSVGSGRSSVVDDDGGVWYRVVRFALDEAYAHYGKYVIFGVLLLEVCLNCTPHTAPRHATPQAPASAPAPAHSAPRHTTPHHTTPHHTTPHHTTPHHTTPHHTILPPPPVTALCRFT